MEIITVREKRIDGELVGYFVNECGYFQKNDCPQIEQWIDQGNTPTPEFTDEELLIKKQTEFRQIRDELLSKADIAIYKAEDLGQDTQLLRAYRQALRDATIDFILPESVI